MQIDAGVNLKPYNTFGLPAVAKTLVRIASDADVRRVVDDKALGRAPKFILGGGSNIILTRDMPQVVLKVEVRGMRIVEERADAWIVEAGAGESWHELVAFTLDQGCPGLENLALIPGTVGAAPVQNIGAYGVELKDRFESLDAVDLVTGRSVTLGPHICAFGYRDSVFKHSLAGRSLITRVRFRLPRPWQPVLGYLELQKKMSRDRHRTRPTRARSSTGSCAIRRAKLPDPAAIGNAGSFFKNPVVTPEQCRDIIGRDPEIVHYPMPDGSVKLAAAWMIDACGWKGKSVGQAGVYEKPGAGARQSRRRDRLGGDDAVAGDPGKRVRAVRDSAGARAGGRVRPARRRPRASQKAWPGSGLPLRCGGHALRGDCPAVLGLGACRITRYVHFVHCAQTDAASQKWSALRGAVEKIGVVALGLEQRGLPLRLANALVEVGDRLLQKRRHQVRVGLRANELADRAELGLALAIGLVLAKILNHCHVRHR